MNYQKIKSALSYRFTEILNFHEPGIAAVKDDSGAYHIDTDGNPLYNERYERTFGFYCCCATVIQNQKWFHIAENGERIYQQDYAWTGNYQEKLCTVRDFENHYFHIDLKGRRIYTKNYLYAGDFKDATACVRLQNGNFKHIDINGDFFNDEEFLNLGVYHKNFAIAKDKNGWHHIDKDGKQIYARRFANIEPFYNGQAKVELFDESMEIIGESGETILKVFTTPNVL